MSKKLVILLALFATPAWSGGFPAPIVTQLSVLAGGGVIVAGGTFATKPQSTGCGSATGGVNCPPKNKDEVSVGAQLPPVGVEANVGGLSK